MNSYGHFTLARVRDHGAVRLARRLAVLAIALFRVDVDGCFHASEDLLPETV